MYGFGLQLTADSYVQKESTRHTAKNRRCRKRMVWNAKKYE